MTRIVIYLLLSVTTALALLVVKDPVSVGLLTGISTALIVSVVDMWGSHPYGPKLLFSALRFRNTWIRVSVSYLVRIEHKGRFLLIRGSRYPDQFQPVGGVYKFNPSAVSLFNKWGVKATTSYLLTMLVQMIYASGLRAGTF